MKAIWKITGRSIQTFFARYLALLLIVFLGVGFFSGLKVTRSAFAATCQSYLDEENFCDFRLMSTLGLTEDDVTAFLDADGVKDAEGQTTVDALLDFEGNTGAYRLQTLPQIVNLPSNTAGRVPYDDGECLADAKAFTEADIGKVLTVIEDNTDSVKDELKVRKFTITGLCNSPLYLGEDRGTASIGSGTPAGFLYILPSAVDAPAYTEINVTLSQKGDIYSDAYEDLADTEKEKLKKLLQERADVRYNDLLDEVETKAREEAEKSAREAVEAQFHELSASGQIPEEMLAAQKEAALKEALAKADEEIPSREELASKAGLERPTVYVLDRSENAGYMSFKNDTAIVSGIANVFPLFFVLIAMLVCITTMSRMVGEERGQIGTLKALGYRNSYIILKYLLYSGSATAFGWALGFFGGTYAIPKVFWLAYSTVYGFAPLRFIFSPALALLTFAISMAGILISTFLTCRGELLTSPAGLMRPKAGKAGKRILLERWRGLWSRLSFLQKIVTRNTFRYKARLLMMLVGISCCTALLVTSFGVRDSLIHMGDEQYGQIQKYQYEAGFSGEEEKIENNIKQLDGVTGTLSCSACRCDLTGAGGTMNTVAVYAFENNSAVSDFWSLKDSRTKTGLDFPGQGEALINEKIAEKLGLSDGDTFDIQDADMNTFSVRVAGIFENRVDNFVLLSADTLKATAGSFAPNTILVQADPFVANILPDQLMSTDEISGVTNLLATKEKIDRTLSCVDYIVALMVLFSGALAFIVIFNLTNINIEERSREIATVEVLGFYPAETNAYVLRENLLSAVLSALIGLPIGYVFHSAVMHMIVVDTMVFDIRIQPLSYVLSVFFTILFALLVDLFMRREIRKIPMAESLKAVE